MFYHKGSDNETKAAKFLQWCSKVKLKLAFNFSVQLLRYKYLVFQT